MGKRSSFERIPRDFYPTPYGALVPLLPFLPVGARFCEPCAGDGRLVDYLTESGLECVCAFDIEPRRYDIDLGDATVCLSVGDPDFYITNPPWTRDVLHSLIGHLSKHRPTWLLFDADWMHTRQSADLMRHCRKIVSVGRVKWIPDSPFTGKDNCCWYLFDQTSDASAQFIGRAA